MRQLVLVVPALILRLSVQPVAGAVQRIPMVRMQSAPAPRTAEIPEVFQPRTDEFRLGDVLGGIRCYEHLSLEAEVEPDAFTQSGLDFLCFYLTDEVDVDVAEMVALDRHCLDFPFNAAALEVAVLLPVDDDGMRILIQCPSRLLQCEGFVLPHLLELRRADFPFPRVFEEQLVGAGNPVGDVLHGLRADFLEIREPLDPLELCQMLLERKLIQRFVVQAVVPLVEGNAMVVDHPCGIDLLMDFPVPCRRIHLVLECLCCRRHCFSPPS